MNDEVGSRDLAKPEQQESKEDQEGALIPLQISQIYFHGDELQVVLVETDGEPRAYVPVRQFCVHLGLGSG